MTDTVQLKVPDLGEFENVEIIEVLVSVGDTVAVEDPLVTIETDKASMDVPAEKAGKIVSLSVEIGSKVSTGSVVAEMELSESAAESDHAETLVMTPAEIGVVASGGMA